MTRKIGAVVRTQRLDYEPKSPKNIVYEWKRASVFGIPDEQHLNDIVQAGWSFVPATRHKKWRSSDGMIRKGSLVLMEVSREKYDSMRQIDHEFAVRDVRRIEEILWGAAKVGSAIHPARNTALPPSFVGMPGLLQRNSIPMLGDKNGIHVLREDKITKRWRFILTWLRRYWPLLASWRVVLLQRDEVELAGMMGISLREFAKAKRDLVRERRISTKTRS